MTEKAKEIILEIQDVRIVRNDPMNLSVERLETTYSSRYKKEFTSYQSKGYYATVLSALKAIVDNELLVEESYLTELKDYVKQVEESNEEVYRILEVIEIGQR